MDHANYEKKRLTSERDDLLLQLESSKGVFKSKIENIESAHQDELSAFQDKCNRLERRISQLQEQHNAETAAITRDA